ncbi:phage tail protein [Cohnella abietis]|uniref:Tail fiber protein n=1 Tax=Cohnella abietis TaxID=2507935 RepID=A0A3T1D307_9BACL|nr:phage tail protein [Cohnella abietis]BBI32496.1 hypothetical protein KCTCHS21_18950 [Cohnella abietis]
MATTPNTKLPLIDQSMTADIPRDFNALAQSVDAVVGDMSTVPTIAKDAAGAIKELQEAISNADIPDATLTKKGKVQLSSATNSTLEDKAATPKAVKSAYDLATANGTTLAEHISDLVRQPADGGTTGGTATAYTCSSTPTPTAFVDKMGVVIAAHLDSGANPTLKWGSLAAKPMLKANGSPAAIKKDGIYTWRYSVIKGAFILQGEGGEYGTAGAADTLAPKTIGTDAGLVAGTMPDRSAAYQTPVAIEGSYQPKKLFVCPPKGYYSGSTEGLSYVVVDDAEFVAANWPTTKTIFGLRGTMPTHDNEEVAVAVFGTTTPQRLYLTPANGYWSGRAVWADEPNFIPANILAGKSMFGLAGTLVKGRAFASGSGTSDSSGVITVTGLAFAPDLIEVEIQNGRSIWILGKPDSINNRWYDASGNIALYGGWAIGANSFSLRPVTSSYAFTYRVYGA